jgi:hypothetical protein
MASQKQIAANKRNAQKSKGPTSEAGKKRSSKNAYRHGLSVPMTDRSTAKIEDLARQFAGSASNAKTYEAAEQAAAADLELERIRLARAMMFECAWRQRKADSRSRRPKLEEGRAQTAGNQNRPVPEPNSGKSKLLDPLPALPEGPEEEERRFMDAVNDALLDLIKTSRYEKRAVAKRERAIHKIISIKIAKNETFSQEISKSIIE